MRKSATNSENAQHLHDKLEQFVTSLLVDLDDGLEKRLVRTFLLAWWSSAEVWVIPGPPCCTLRSWVRASKPTAPD
jgi:hypothetical protein